MKPYTHSKDSKKIKLGKFYIIVTAAFVIWSLASLYSASVEMRRLVVDRAEILAQIEQEEQKQVNAVNEKLYFESDSYIEKIAREKLGLVKPGDVVFIDRNAK